MVLAFHWNGGTMHDVEATSTSYGHRSYYGLHDLGASSTIFIAPQGVDDEWLHANGDDMAFVDAILHYVDKWLCVDQTQRYVVGFSSSMAYAIATSRGRQFRAIVVISGSTDFVDVVKNHPVAFVVAHGVSDPSNPIDQGRLMRDLFVQINGCVNETALEPAPGSASHIQTTYQNCTSGYPVTYIAFDGGQQYSPVDTEATTSWLSRAIWDFFLLAPLPSYTTRSE